MNDEKDRIEIHKKEKLPFAIFISTTNKDKKNVEDYKEIFADIISNKIKQ